MNWKPYTVELITPCFCAGADQTTAEIRAPSIRGELRWWFRVLGGTPEQERAVFGGELSGHFYYRDNYYADSGLITLVHVINILTNMGEEEWVNLGVEEKLKAETASEDDA